jgi:glycosyltransferase involved in cell wall biosynthesis
MQVARVTEATLLDRVSREKPAALGGLPRLLVLDLTAKGDGTATGEVKATIFADWPDDRYLQIYSKGNRDLGVQHGSRIEAESYAYPDDFTRLIGVINDFQPEVVLYRPVPDAGALHAMSMHIIEAQPDLPLVTWIMDDWPARLEVDDPNQFAGLNENWLWLLERSSLRLSIGERMSAVLKDRYGYDFVPFANGIDPAEWPERQHEPGEDFVIRYAGGLAENMTARSVLRVAESVEALANEGHRIRLEIRTRPVWEAKQRRYYSRLKHTKILTDLLPNDAYKEWLGSADAVLIAYNFDPESLRYVGLSIANKLPECLASGVPLIAHGPQAAATIAYLESQGCALVLDEDSSTEVKDGLRRLLDRNFGKLLAVRAREVALERHDIRDVRDAFAASMIEVANPSSGESQGGLGFDSTLFLLGNGPSLKGVDFERLRKFDCLGMNAAYRYWHEIKWYPRYYACLDLVVGLSHKDAITDLIRGSDEYGIDLFFLRPNLVEALPEDLRSSSKVIVFDRFCESRLGDAPKGVTTGSHSAIIGALLGYSRLALLGIDCNYVEEVKGSKRAGGIVLEMTETPKENPNYFFEGYQAAGDKYNIPNPSPDLHVQSWRAVAPFLKERGIKVWNCSPISRVDAFPFREFDEMERDQQVRGERPRTLRVDRILATPVVRRREVAERNVQPRVSLIGRLVGLAEWCLQALWRRRRGLGGIAMAAVLLPLILAPFAPGALLSWLLVGLSALFGLGVLGGLVALRLVEALGARAAAYAREAQLDAEAAAYRQISRVLSTAETYAREQASIAVSKATHDFSAQLEPLEQSVADLATLLLTMGPVLTGGSALEELSKQDRHGSSHLLLMAALIDKARQDPLALKGKTLAEVGARNGATEQFAILAAMLGMKFVSIDAANGESRRGPLRKRLGLEATIVVQKGDEWLAELSRPLDFLALDATTSCVKAVGEKMAKGGLVVLDDPRVPTPIEALFEVVARAENAVLLKRL